MSVEKEVVAAIVKQVFEGEPQLSPEHGNRATTADLGLCFEGRQPVIPAPEDRQPAIPQGYEDLVKPADDESTAPGGHMGPLYLDVLSPWELLCARASGRLTNTASEVLSARALVALASALPHAELSKELVDRRLDAASAKDAPPELRSAACRVVGLAVRGATPGRELAAAFAGL